MYIPDWQKCIVENQYSSSLHHGEKATHNEGWRSVWSYLLHLRPRSQLSRGSVCCPGHTTGYYNRST